MLATINGRNELIVHLELITQEIQRQSNRQWRVSIAGIMVAHLDCGNSGHNHCCNEVNWESF